jgi:hypothetical protein
MQAKWHPHSTPKLHCTTKASRYTSTGIREDQRALQSIYNVLLPHQSAPRSNPSEPILPFQTAITRIHRQPPRRKLSDSRILHLPDRKLPTLSTLKLYTTKTGLGLCSQPRDGQANPAPIQNSEAREIPNVLSINTHRNTQRNQTKQ